MIIKLLPDFRGFPSVRRGQRRLHNPGRDVQHRGRYLSDGGEYNVDENRKLNLKKKPTVEISRRAKLGTFFSYL